jgi:polysaccharide export outer membrane protein
MRSKFVLLALAGCAFVAMRPMRAQQPVQQMRDTKDTIPSFVVRASAAHAEPGDRVYLHVWREQKLSDTVTVDEKGDVLFPKIGVISAASMTIGDFRDTVRTRFAEYLRDSPVDVTVLRRVAVNGEVNKPDVYYMDVSMTLRDVIARAGGITDNGNPNNVAVVRGTQRIPVRDWQEDRSTTSDLRSGDQIVVGRKNWFSMNALSVISVSTVVASLIISLARR